jgi:hypothetical protein
MLPYLLTTGLMHDARKEAKKLWSQSVLFFWGKIRPIFQQRNCGKK